MAEDAFDNFKENLQKVEVISEKLKDDDYLPKILYAHIITLMEEYFYNTFKSKVLNDDTVFEKLLEIYPFKKIKIPLIEAYNKDSGDINSYIKKLITSSIDNLIFHKLPVVDEIYKKALDIRIPINSDLTDAVIKRHDIVHRNGKDKEGDEVDITKAEVDELINIMSEFIENVNTEIEQKF